MASNRVLEGPFKIGPPLTVYKDKYPLTALTTVEYIEEFQEMEVREEDVFIVTYPKSGTHWMQELVHLIFADGDANRIGASQRISVAEMAHAANPELTATTDPTFRLQRDLPSPRVFTTPLPCALLPKQIWEKQCKVIYVYRHPKDVICSFYNFTRKVHKIFYGTDVLDIPQAFDRFFKAALSGDVEYGSWFDHILGYSPHRDKNHFFFVTFEDMKRDMDSVIKRVGSFLGRDVDEETVQKIIHGSSFDTMKQSFEKNHQKMLDQKTGNMHLDMFFNIGTTAQWKTRFTKEQNAEFDEMFRIRMKDCELTRDYESV